MTTTTDLGNYGQDIDLGYGEDQLGYGAAPTSCDLGYGLTDEGLGYCPTASSDFLGYGNDPDLGYGTQQGDTQHDLGYGSDNGNKASNTAPQPNKRQGARRRCSVTKYSLDTPETIKAKNDKKMSSRSEYSVFTSDESFSSDDDSEAESAFDIPLKEEKKTKNKGKTLFRRVRRAMSAI